MPKKIARSMEGLDERRKNILQTFLYTILRGFKIYRRFLKFNNKKRAAVTEVILSRYNM